MARVSYSFFITIPANTTEEIQLIKTDAITGIVKKIFIDIPFWNYLAGFRMIFGKQQQLPASITDGETYFTGDDNDPFLEPDIELIEDRLEIRGVNNDATNAHNAVIILEVEQI